MYKTPDAVVVVVVMMVVRSRMMGIVMTVAMQPKASKRADSFSLRNGP
jgi:hypothetical protein